MRIRKIDGYYAPLDYPAALDNRWKSSDFLDMVERYSLHDTNGFTGPIIDQIDGPKLPFTVPLTISSPTRLRSFTISRSPNNPVAEICSSRLPNTP